MCYDPWLSATNHLYLVRSANICYCVLFAMIWHYICCVLHFDWHICHQSRAECLHLRHPLGRHSNPQPSHIYDLTLYALICSPPAICYSLRWVSAIVYYCLLLPFVMNWAGAIGYHLAANICHSFPLSTITWYRLLSFDLIYYQLILLSARIYYYPVSCGTLNYYLQLLVLSAVVCYYLLDLLLSAIIEYDLLWSTILCCDLSQSATFCYCDRLLSAIVYYYVLLSATICYHLLLCATTSYHSAMICYDLLFSAIVCSCLLVAAIICDLCFVISCYYLL